MNKILALTATLTLCLLAACGGGGGSSDPSSGGNSGGSSGGSSGGGSSGGSSDTNVSNPGTPSSPGGGTAGNLITPGPSSSSNVATVFVDQGPAAYQQNYNAAVNTLYVSVTVCLPGYTDSAHCQTIDHVQVDTGSSGLRILSSALTLGGFVNATVSNTTASGALAECLPFVDGSSWGPVVNADVYVGGANAAGSGEKASNILMQIVGGSATNVPSTPPGTCTGTPENTVDTFGANGLIGVGSFQQDCGACCTASWSADGCENGNQPGNAGRYYACTSASASACTVTTAELSQQLINPVTAFTDGNNNGVVISLPGVGSGGAQSVTGTLTFGVGTASNNAPPSAATLLYLDPFYGEFTTTYNGTALSQSYLDSGSNALYFDSSNSSLVICGSNSSAPDFYCPASTQSLSATLTSYSGSGAGSGGANNYVANFSIANAGTLFGNATYAAFNNLGAPQSAVSGGASSSSSGATFDWGLPFFYGLNVYATTQSSDSPQSSPSVAFLSNGGTVLNQ